MLGASHELVLSNKKDNRNTGIVQNNDSSLVATLSYLSNILLEENIDDEEEVSFKEGTALQAMEKNFADIINQKNPQPQVYPTSTNEPLQDQINFILQSIPTLEYNKGVEEGLKFFPSMEKLMIDSQGKKFSAPPHSSTEEENEDLGCVVKGSNGKNKLDSSTEEENEYLGCVINGSNGKNKFDNRNLDLPEGRNCKIPLAYSEEPVRDAKLDEVILYYDNDYFKKVASVREMMQASTCSEKEVQEQYIDLRDLLILCSHSIAANDHQTAQDFIKQIRKQTFPDGDGNQRLALELANALEARLTGTGTELYNRSVTKRISTSDIVKVQYLFMTVTPFLRCTYGHTHRGYILRSLEKASKLHIIDFGIDFGFQWPSLIQQLSEKKMDIKLKITGIDFPRSGFRPTERVDETGRRLKEYAKSFNVPFQYHGIASKWEEICIEDLKIENDEVLIVNSMYRFRQLGDESVALDSPRNQVLNFIRRLKPRLFLLGVVNGTFSPFFVTRFRQVLLHYAPLFDILDAFLPRDNRVRHIIERDMLAREVMNLIACEGPSWVERPEPYKQWHLRNLRAGFEQVALEPTFVEICKQKYKKIHDKRYFVEEESNWLLQGWRGKTLHAISCWKPKQEAA